VDCNLHAIGKRKGDGGYGARGNVGVCELLSCGLRTSYSITTVLCIGMCIYNVAFLEAHRNLRTTFLPHPPERRRLFSLPPISRLAPEGRNLTLNRLICTP